ncbi:histidine phosphatase family protein [Reyranella sp.]|uniref:histidine phosphatase family protein n=1 Tax=Reyranella sp. TaxID=1929291 RepID=UPI003784BEBF
MTLTVPLYVLRHGETFWNTERRMQGMRDSKLTERGRLQAEAMGRTLERELEAAAGPTVFLRSPLGRACETAEIIGRAIGLDPGQWRDDPRLVELGYGDWEGLHWKEIEVTHPTALADWRADPHGYYPPGGETHTDLRARSAAVLAEIAASGVRTASAAPSCAASISASMPARCSSWRNRRTPSSACSLAARTGSSAGSVPMVQDVVVYSLPVSGRTGLGLVGAPAVRVISPSAGTVIMNVCLAGGTGLGREHTKSTPKGLPFDQNLSHRLVERLREEFPDSLHVRESIEAPPTTPRRSSRSSRA